MATHDYVIANQGFPAFRSDLNDALAAIVSNNSSATAPSTTFAHQVWVDTAANPSILKIRNADNDAWITIGSLNQTDDKFKLTPADGVSTDTISELTSAAGVTIDGVLLKDNGVVTGAGTVSAPVYSTTGDLNTGIFFPAADTIAFAEGGAEAMRIDSDGDVGIGTTAPAKKLHVSGGSSGGTFPTDTILAIEDNDGTTLSLLGGTSSILGITLGDSADNDRFKIECNTTSGSRYMAFTVDASERMRIDSSGNLNVGRTVATTSNTVGCSVLGVGAIIAERDNDICMSLNRLNGNGIGVLFSRGAGNDVGNITLNTSTTTYNTSSDYRLKENIAPMTGALEKVAQLKPVTYTWKVDGSAGQGFIAHELAEVVPDCVSGEKDAVETYTDEDGNEQTRIKPQGIDTSFLVATLTAAIQELSAKNDALEARIAALEGSA